MHKLSHSVFGLLIIATVVQGCKPANEKTDSMVFRETAIRNAQKPLEKAYELLTDEVKGAPIAHLDTLLLAKNQLQDAKRIYEKSNIRGYKDSKLEHLDDFYQDLTPELIVLAKQLLEQVVERTVTLRREIEETKTRPYSARGMDVKQMVKFLGQQYNKDVKGCCLQNLSKIDLLLQSQAKQHRDLLVLIRSINSELGEIIKDEAYAPRLMKTISSI